jgi:hypothetical protein
MSFERDYDGLMRHLRRVQSHARPVYAEQDAIDFAVEWLSTNGDAVREFLGEFDDEDED